jgi:hypothetical protein
LVLKEVYQLLYNPKETNDHSPEVLIALSTIANEGLEKLKATEGYTLTLLQSIAVKDVYHLSYAEPASVPVSVSSSCSLEPVVQELDHSSTCLTSYSTHGGAYGQTILPSFSGFTSTPSWTIFNKPAAGYSARSVSSFQDCLPVDSRKRPSEYDEIVGRLPKRIPPSDIQYSTLSSLGSGTIPRSKFTGTFLSATSVSPTRDTTPRFSDILVQPSSDVASRRESMQRDAERRQQRISSNGNQTTVAKIILNNNFF